MICNARDLPSDLNLGKAILVVGGGPVGLVIARQLSYLGLSVWVLEAGQERSNENGRDCLKVEFGSQILPGTSIGRTRQLGGGLNLWGGQLARLHAEEMAQANGPGLGWPIGNDALSTSLETAMLLLGQTAWPKTIPSAISAMKDGLAGYDLEPVVTTWLRSPKWTRSVWTSLAQSPSIRIVLGLAVDGIRLDSKRTGVDGVSARTPDGTRLSVHASTVIIACGTIEAIRVLLQPDEAGHPQPWHNLPWLGRGFCEHLDAEVAMLAIQRSQPMADMFDPLFADGIKQTWKLFGQVRLGDDTKASGVITLGLPGNVRNTLSEFRLLMRGLAPRTIPGCAPRILRAGFASIREIGPLAWRYLRHRRHGTTFRGVAVLRASIEQPVRRDNRILLAETRDRLGIRRVRIHWRTGVEEGEIFLSLAERVCAWLEAIGAGHATINPDLRRDPIAFARQADDGLHHSGGARMSLSPMTGVVRTDLQVHGMVGLFVCGACVFPRAGFANPTLTAAALGVRLAHHLAAIRRGHMA